LGIIPPTIYLCLLDGIALRHQVWSISETHTTGLMVGPLPIEEVLFFLITNILVIQGLALFIDRVQHHRRRSAHHVAPV
ncbi:MAG: lycopene cyclase domain-containing protein, partial [Myxococcota bacterium]